jgi:hypothetical protein
MAEPRCASVKYVAGPGARSLTTDDLPDAEATRWVIRRKAEVVAAGHGGLLSLDEACSRYMLSIEEIRSWQYSLDQHGLAGLRTTRTQKYRRPPAIGDHNL